MIKEIVTGAPNDAQHQDNAHPKTSPIDCGGALLTTELYNCNAHLKPDRKQ